MKSFLAILTFLTLQASAQTEEDRVKQPITSFFNGMRQTDTALIRSSLAPGAVLQTVAKNKEGKVSVQTDDLNKFILSIAQPRDFILDERITYDVIRIDGDLAVARTPYQFYVGDKFHHCGVNSFQLVRIGGEWKIQYIIDTRRREGCGN
jgi:hypothetical protein